MYTIAHIENNYTEKFGVPRQSGLVNAMISKIVFEPEFRNADALRGLEDFSHIWLIWEFSEAVRRGKGGEGETAEATDKSCEWRPTVRPPRLGGNARIGVFATRSPFRPNPIGLSCVELERIDYDAENGPVIYVRGADLMSGTPIFDIKPYIPYADSKPEAKGGFTDTTEFKKTCVTIAETVACRLKPEEAEELKEILEQDPRPAYKRDTAKTYNFNFSRYDVTFEARGEEIIVTDVREL